MQRKDQRSPHLYPLPQGADGGGSASFTPFPLAGEGTDGGTRAAVSPSPRPPIEGAGIDYLPLLAHTGEKLRGPLYLLFPLWERGNRR
jgi:hypothetical protein